MNASRHPILLSLLVCLSAATLAACGDQPAPTASVEPAAPADFERGPHNGRLLREGDLSLEVTVFEDGVPPEFHVYPYRNNQPLDPRQVQLGMSVSRLGGEVNQFAFTPQQDYLRADAVVDEPHSFDVAVTATLNGMQHAWTYESYEGRTTIAQAAADAAGVKTETAGQAVMEESITAAGRVELQPQGRNEVRAWYPGRVMEMTKVIGQRVQKGETLARVESSSSLQTYAIPAPMAGVITERQANVGDVAGDQALYVISDAAKVHAEVFLFPGDAEKVRVGQGVAAGGVLAQTTGHSCFILLTIGLFFLSKRNSGQAGGQQTYGQEAKRFIERCHTNSFVGCLTVSTEPASVRTLARR